MIKSNKKQVLLEQYSQIDSSSLTFKEYVEREAENDPNFFRWLFDEEFEQDFNLSLSDEEKKEFKNFLKTLIEYKVVINIWDDNHDSIIILWGTKDLVDRYESREDNIFELAENCGASEGQIKKISWARELQNNFRSCVKFCDKEIKRY